MTVEALRPTSKEVVTESQGRISLHTVLRDSRGKIVWKLPGNTDEENIQLGVNNIQAVFLQKFPEFDFFFARDTKRKVEKDRRDEAIAFIKDKIGSKKKLSSLVGSSRTLKVAGNFTNTINTTFSPWGLKIFDTVRKIDKSTSTHIDSEGNRWVTGAFLRKQYRYPHGLLGEISTQNGLDKAGRETKLYSEKEAIARLEHYSKVPQVNVNSRYIDSKGRHWVSIPTLAEELSLPYWTVHSLIRGKPFISSRNNKGKKMRLYDEKEVRERVAYLLSLPAIDNTSKRVIDDQGNIWVSLSTISDKYGISPTTVKLNSSTVRSITGRDQCNHIIPLYNEHDFAQIFGEYSQLPRLDRKTKKYVDSTGMAWTSIHTLAKVLNVSRHILVRLIKDHGLSSIRGRDSSGQEIKFFSEEEVIRALNSDEILMEKDKIVIRLEQIREEMDRLFDM